MTTHPETRWVFPNRNAKLEAELTQRLRISPILAQVLMNRNITGVDAARKFLRPNLSGLEDPWDLPDMQKASDRIREAIEQQERIVIYGDYDVDGITATALLLRCLRMAGAEVAYYLPERMEEGYGLNVAALRQFKGEGARLVVTVDCGISAIEEARVARKLGIDLIITDHHEPGPELPDAYALVSPRIAGCTYPFKDLAGVGIAFKVAWAIGKSFSSGVKVSDDFKDFLTDAVGLAALGTVADVAPICGENRILTAYGLGALGESSSPGIMALLLVSSAEDRRLSTWDISFRIGPRLNAAGRLGDARRGVELLTTEDTTVAREIADLLDRENTDRREIQDGIFQHAREKVEREVDVASARAIVLADPGWHPGVIGIVASKICEQYYRPTLLIAIDEEGIGHGSARSIPGFHLYDALCNFRSILLSFGGHERAAGLKIKKDAIPALADGLNEFAASVLSEEDLLPQVRVDAEARLASLSRPVVSELEMLAPHGEGNPPPVLASTDVTIAGRPRRMGRDGAHLSFYAQQDGTTIRAVAFGMGELEGLLSEKGRPVAIAYEPYLDTWKGSESVQLKIKDIQVEP
ncbi:MAG: single-stranded-DNA-specific exonuclease RecJ [Planctomycetes bacterium]|nr:single-stranded-DNA-specific exonuclease RecJ [Planctomycetota bacterium]